MKKSAFHQRLSYKQAKYTVLVALLLGLIFSAIQIAMDISQSRSSMDDKVQQVIQLVEESAVQAAYNIDQDLAERVVKGLINHAYIHFAQIRLDDNSVLASSDSQTSTSGMMSKIMDEERRSYSVPLNTVFEEAPVGTLIVESDPAALNADIFDRAIVILSTGFLRNVLLAVCLFYVFHALISRPLTLFSDRLNLLKNSSNSKTIPAIKGHSDDELGFLVNSFNELWQSRNQAEEALRGSEQFNRDVMNSISDMLIICEEDFRIYNANHKTLHTLGFDKKDLLDTSFAQLFKERQLPTQLAQLKPEDQLSQEVILESQLTRQDGQHLPVEIRARSIELSGSTYILALCTDISQRKQQEAQIHHLAYFDSLTDLPNRSLFLDRLNQVQSKSLRHNTLSALLFLDLDRFKNINDSLGHDVGDELLIIVAKRLKEMMRDEDTVARLGGDEFVIILNELAIDSEAAALNAQRITTRILEIMAKPFYIGQHTLHISASVGIRLFPDDDDNDIKNIVKQADTALYRAKSNGKNTFHFYRPSMQLLADQHLAMERALHTALESNELYLHYQPQVDHNFTIVGTEALIRWQHPEQGFVPPDQFIGIAEETGLIIPIGRWVLEQACHQLAIWQNEGLCPDNFRMAVNISAKQFDHPQFLTVLSEVIETTGIDPNKLELELTESLLVKNMDAIINRMSAIRSMGIALSIDDFGTGYSSLKYLKQMPITQLKIDKSFVMDLLTDINDRAITETIIAMATHLQMDIIAEGVEDAPIMDLLVKLGCKHFQGYYFSRPVSADNCSQLLQVQKLPLGS